MQLSIVRLDGVQGWIGQLEIEWLIVSVVRLLVDKVIKVKRGVGGQL